MKNHLPSKSGIPYYPGKPGPAPSGGLKRKLIFPFNVTGDEYEFLVRLARENKTKVVKMIRKKFFVYGWETWLENLRKEQGANVKED